jgi:DNA-binding PadR family transcriptional regulator
MKLTRRQESFIRNLLDLSREVAGPIHYSVLAERLGVSPFTAYDMLRLLEEKGFVASEYQLAAGKTGPGRSEIVFLPTERARQLMTRIVGEAGGADWEAIKERVLEKVRAGEIREQELAKQMLARVPPGGSGVVRYCVEVMTVVALRLQHRAGRRLLLEYLPQILPVKDHSACRANLGLLGGFALGILAEENADDREWGRELLKHVQRYHSLVIAMEPNASRRLAANLRQVFAPLMKGD